ncbi:hypothetical protein SAMN05421835_12370 [Amycolatopsis sacchari]|uniref:Uncharacterized protein n=1 Tax=Amycolatopsis sacchari TaxID=115433 RepID=A0A1I4A9D6_9PSEU|nr:hypothetical protein [Amycolatopsis sacchari]SFK52707.1 hypothetical protein SAMN05421835_12370 [Amycolatopsis sacchari]
MSRRQAEALFGELDADYDEVFAVQGEAARRADAVELAELAELSALLDELDAELEAAEQVAAVRVPRFIDPQRAGRSRRRVERSVLRSLPTRLDLADLAELGEAAEGEAA